MTTVFMKQRRDFLDWKKDISIAARNLASVPVNITGFSPWYFPNFPFTCQLITDSSAQLATFFGRKKAPPPFHKPVFASQATVSMTYLQLTMLSRSQSTAEVVKRNSNRIPSRIRSKLLDSISFILQRSKIFETVLTSRQK